LAERTAMLHRPSFVRMPQWEISPWRFPKVP
jgi:hypothetical protein